MLSQYSRITLLILLLLSCHVPSGTKAFSHQSRRQTTNEFIDQFYTAYARKDIEKLTSFYADQVYFEDPTFDLKYENKAQIRTTFERSAPAFSDIVWEIKYRVIAGNQIAVEGIFSGKFNSKPFSGVRFATFFTLRDGKIVRHIDFFDKEALQRQIKGHV